MAKSPTSKATTNKTATKRPKAASGMRKGLTAYGDPGFSLFLRKAFIKAAASPTTRSTGRSSESPTPRPTTIPATAMSARSSRR